jgi:phosphoglycerate dehydrogenase-like enzyme
MPQVPSSHADAIPWRPKVAFSMTSNRLRDSVLGAEGLARLGTIAQVLSPDVITEAASARSLRLLAEADVLLTSWGSVAVDRALLDAAPQLKLVAHAAGSVKGFVHRDCYLRGVAVTSAAAANAIPVAEYTLAMILLAGKDVFPAGVRRGEPSGIGDVQTRVAGNNGAVVGIIGASHTGRKLMELVRPFSFTVLLADPTVDRQAAHELGAQLVGLNELMARSDVVTLHAPVLPSTIGMIGSDQLGAMRDDTMFINTARGVLVDHDALRRELGSGRIRAILDVTDPEPLPEDDELRFLPNVALTPHVAGSQGNENLRLGQSAIAEIERLALDLPLRYPVTLGNWDSVG